MLSDTVILGDIVSTFRANPALVTALGGPQQIVVHYFYFGLDQSLAKAIADMPTPGILLAYTGNIGGNFSAMEVWKHLVDAYIFPPNAAMAAGPVSTAPTGITPASIWRLAMNSPIDGFGERNIREIQLCDNRLMLEARPNLTLSQDEKQSDFFVANMVWTEFGDD